MSFFTKTDLHDPPTDEERASAPYKALIDAKTKAIHYALSDAERANANEAEALKDFLAARGATHAALHVLWNLQAELKALGVTVPPPRTFEIPIQTNRLDPLANARALYPSEFK